MLIVKWCFGKATQTWLYEMTHSRVETAFLADLTVLFSATEASGMVSVECRALRIAAGKEPMNPDLTTWTHLHLRETACDADIRTRLRQVCMLIETTDSPVGYPDDPGGG
jgi:hypothetical protein